MSVSREFLKLYPANQLLKFWIPGYQGRTQLVCCRRRKGIRIGDCIVHLELSSGPDCILINCDNTQRQTPYISQCLLRLGLPSCPA